MIYIANGNVITSNRHDNPTATGALGTPTSGDETRVHYSGSDFYAAGREIADLDVGPNGGTAWTRPSSVPTPSATMLVTSYGYAADSLQLVQLTGSLTGRTFTLSFGGDPTSTIAYNASASTGCPQNSTRGLIFS